MIRLGLSVVGNFTFNSTFALSTYFINVNVFCDLDDTYMEETEYRNKRKQKTNVKPSNHHQSFSKIQTLSMKLLPISPTPLSSSNCALIVVNSNTFRILI